MRGRERSDDDCKYHSGPKKGAAIHECLGHGNVRSSQDTRAASTNEKGIVNAKVIGLGLFSAGFAVLCCFTCFALVSAALAAFCLVLGWSLPVSLFCAGFALLC